MNSDNKSISLRIGAELGSSFKKTFEGADNRLKRLNSTVKDFKKQMGNVSALQKQEAKTKQAGKAWREASHKIADYKKTLKELESPTNKQLVKLNRLAGNVRQAEINFSSFQEKVNRSGQATQKQTEKLTALGIKLKKAKMASADYQEEVKLLTTVTSKHQAKLAGLVKTANKAQSAFNKERNSATTLRQSLSQAGINTRELTQENKRLENSMKAVTSRADRLNASLNRIQQNRDHRADLRGGLMETVATTAAAAFPIVNAAKAQESSDYLNTVLSLGKVDPKVARLAKNASLNAARMGVTTFAGANEIQYAFNSAGLGNTSGREAVVPVAKAARLMKVDNATLANDVAGAINNFYKDKINMNDPNAVKKANTEVTDLFTAAQMKFHYQDFSAINEALKYAAGSMQQQGVDLGQGLTVLGMMANGRVAASTQGTALRAILTQLSAKGNASQYIVRDTQGNMELLATLKNLKENLSTDKDEQIKQLTGIFGSEMASPIAQTLNAMKEATKDYTDLMKNAPGIVNRKYAEMAKHTSFKWKKLTSNLDVLSMTIGGPMLDVVNGIITPLTSLVVGVSEASQAFPNFTRVLFSALSALAVFKVGKFAFGYGSALLGQVGNYARLGGSYLGAGGGAVKEGSSWLSRLKPKWLDKVGKSKLGKMGGKALGGLGKAGGLISAATATPVYVTNMGDLGGSLGSTLGNIEKKGPLKEAKKLGRLGRIGGVLGKFGKVLGPLALLGTGMDILSTSTNEALTGHQKAKRIGGDVGGLSGGAIGAIAGAAIGSVIPVVGTWIGGVAGSLIGSWFGNKAGQKIVDLVDPKEHVKQMATSQVNNHNSQQQNEITINNHINQSINSSQGQSAQDIAKHSANELKQRIYDINPMYDAIALGGQP
ncbi:phage tail tape measure protein [Piscirickettsia litoralis]|uniref:Phage tail tape measure protein n=1 Tax=Piscirickettsia litoralis TaxID=1891921 RepID=A0ABX2ZX30_9GAMM|nr:phage tail tape measure protein [Piscirickettsia litoralis]ODN41156.1 phage tail tape measure protein [Piscirickettsia litoralis]